MENGSLLQIEGLTVEIKDHRIVNDVSITLEKQKTLCLVGESGSGKTSTAMGIMGLLSKKVGYRVKGKVLFENQDLVRMSDRQLRSIRGAKLSMIFQDPSLSLNPVFSIGDQISEMYEIHTHLTTEEAQVKSIEALESVGLASILDPFETYPHQLSGGMKQRVMIAIALSLEPQALIADEPTSALDLTVQKEILALLRSYTGSKLIITHDFGVVAEMADNVAVMYAGELVEYGSVYDIFDKPAHPYTIGLLSCRPTAENRKKILPTVPQMPRGGEIVHLSPTHWMRKP